MTWLRSRSEGFWFVSAAFGIMVAGGLVSWIFWEELHHKQDGFPITIRNLGLVIGGFIAILLAIWRSRVAEKQADTAQRQAENATKTASATERQVTLALESFLDKRYAEGVRMLGSDTAFIRSAGVDTVDRLARDHPEKFHVPVTRQLCEFVRDLANAGGSRQEARIAITVIGSRNADVIAREIEAGYKLDLPGVDLHSLNLTGANLTRGDLMRANLSDTHLWNARLSECKFAGAYLTDAILYDADVSGAAFSIDGHYPVVGLTQAQLDSACAEPTNPPKLEGLRDPDTGAALTPPSNRPNMLQELEASLDQATKATETGRES